MIKYILHKDLDKVKWDLAIQNASNGIVYAFSWYLDIVCNGKWDALVKGDYEQVMPLPRGEKKFGLLYTYCPSFAQQLGVFSSTGTTSEETSEFINSIPSKYVHLKINLNTGNYFSDSSFQVSQGVTHLLKLNATYEVLYANYKRRIKGNLKKALTGGLTITKNTEPIKIINLFKENRGKQYAISNANYNMLNELMTVCIDKGIGEAWGVHTRDAQLCGGAFFLKSNGKVIFLFTGANDRAYETQAMTFLLNRYFEENAGKNLVFDFEGSLDVEVAKFYKGFGSIETHFIKLEKDLTPAPIKWVKKITRR